MKNYQKLEKTNIADLLCGISDGVTDCLLDVLEPSADHEENCPMLASLPEGVKNPHYQCHQCICKWLNEDIKS